MMRPQSKYVNSLNPISIQEIVYSFSQRISQDPLLSELVWHSRHFAIIAEM